MDTKPRLEHLFVEITNKCFLNCIHCSSNAFQSSSEQIPLKSLVALLDQASRLGVRALTISGGEPLTYPDLGCLLDYIKMQRLRCRIYTCGVLRSQTGTLVPLSNDIIELLKSNDISGLIFSLQGATPDTHDGITGVQGSFEIVLESMQQAVSAGLNCEIHFVVMQSNFSEIRAVVDLTKKFGLSEVSLLRLVPQGRACFQPNEMVIDKAIASQVVSDVSALRKEYRNIRIRLGSPFNCVAKRRTPCSAGYNKLLISASGEGLPCEAFKSLIGQRHITIYNRSLEAIWEEDGLLKDLRRTTMSNEMCMGCRLYNTCHGGCAGQRMLQSGDLKTGKDPWCPLAV